MSVMPWARNSGAATPGHAPRGFTLLELMVVMVVLCLLVMILMPSLGKAFEVAYTTMCQRNLECLGQAMHGDSVNEPFNVPAGAVWTSHAVQYGSEDLLFCKKDYEDHNVGLEALDEYYVLQKQHTGAWTVTSVVAALGIGGGVIEDNQVRRDDQLPREPPPCSGGHPCFCKVPVRRENQQCLSICSEAHILITLERSRVVLESYHGCTALRGTTNSDHWLMRGPGVNGVNHFPEEELIMQLGGKNYRAEPNPRHKHVLTAEKTSYGINSVIEPKVFGPRQIMIMDANMIEIPVGEGDWLDHIKARHLGKVNYVDVGGAVHSMRLADMYSEYLLYEDEGPSSRSLWSPQAAPRMKY